MPSTGPSSVWCSKRTPTGAAMDDMRLLRVYGRSCTPPGSPPANVSPGFPSRAALGAGRAARLLQRAADPLARHLPARAERLRELVDAQLLEHPAHLGERGRAPPRVAHALVLGLELVDGAHAVAVDRHGVRKLLEAALGGAQIALDVGQPRHAGRGDEAGMDEP